MKLKKAKGADKAKLKQLKTNGNLDEIIDVALDWPLYFSKRYPCQEATLNATEIAFDYLGLYLLKNSKVSFHFHFHFSFFLKKKTKQNFSKRMF